MQFIETGIHDLWEIDPVIHRDARGYFLESFQLEKLQSVGINGPFVQDNQSFSIKGVLRGLHYQKSPHQQGKLVSVTIGKVLDIVVDIRKSSPTFGNHFRCILDAERHNILYIPEGMAHGFLAWKTPCLSINAPTCIIRKVKGVSFGTTLILKLTGV